MKMLRKLLRLDNSHDVAETETKIREARADYDDKMSRIERQQHAQVFNHRIAADEALMKQWGNVMEILQK